MKVATVDLSRARDVPHHVVISPVRGLGWKLAASALVDPHVSRAVNPDKILGSVQTTLHIACTVVRLSFGAVMVGG